MKNLRTIALFLVCSLSPIADNLFAEQITMDLSTATDLNGNPVSYSTSYGTGYYNLTDVWEQTYNDADSCRQILVNDGVFRLSHLPSGMAYGGMSWEGFTLSTISQDTANVLACVANGGLKGEGVPYVIGYYSEWVSQSQGFSSNVIDFNGEYQPEFVYICQNCNTYKAITQGELNARAFTLTDTLALIIQALDNNMHPTASITYYLAVDGQKNAGWEKVSLSELGMTSRLSFSMTTTDTGDFGANTPLYFALDALTINTQPVTHVLNPALPVATKKIIQNGHLYILHTSTIYNILGIKFF
jgi:hypothetical protein